MERTVNTSEEYIDYRLNIIGIRVWAATCQLISRQRDIWNAFGAPRPLPLRVPSPAQAVGGGHDELHMTASQFLTQNRASDLAAVLSQSKNFSAALKG